MGGDLFDYVQLHILFKYRGGKCALLKETNELRPSVCIKMAFSRGRGIR